MQKLFRRVGWGRAATALLDYCAAAPTIPEEVACVIVTRALTGVAEGRLHTTGRLYPITRIDKYSKVNVVIGISDGA